MRANLLLVLGMFLGSQAILAQDSTNPFELLWRLDPSGKVKSYAETAPPIPPAEVATSNVRESETTLPKVEEAIPMPPPAPPVTVTEEAPAPPIEMPAVDSNTIEAVVNMDTSAIAAAAVDTSTYASVEEEAAEPEPEEAVEAVAPAPETKKPEKAVTPPPVFEPSEIPSLVLVLIFGVVFALLAWVLSLSRDLLKKVYRAALNENYSNLLFREQRFATTQYLYYIIYLVFFVTGGMFLFLLGQHFSWTAWVFRSIWTCIGLVGVVYLLRHLCLNILGNTYPVTKETTQFSFSILLHNILLGIGLIPVTLFLAFGPENLTRIAAIAGIALCGLVYLMRQFRGLVIGGSLLGSNPLHFFVYLCAVEILPLYTLIKFFYH